MPPTSMFQRGVSRQNTMSTEAKVELYRPLAIPTSLIEKVLSYS